MDSLRILSSLVLLSMVTYVMAFSIYLLERTNDSEHFGSIVRAFWFSLSR